MLFAIYVCINKSSSSIHGYYPSIVKSVTHAAEMNHHKNIFFHLWSQDITLKFRIFFSEI